MSKVDVANEPPNTEADGGASPPTGETKSDEPIPSSTSSRANCVPAALAAVLGLSVALGSGVGIGYAAGRSKSSESCGAVTELMDDVDFLSAIEFSATYQCSAESLGSRDGVQQCRDFCAPATCCFSPSRQGSGSKASGRVPGTGRRLSDIDRSAHKGSAKYTYGGEGDSKCLGQKLCDAFKPCVNLHRNDFASIQSEVRAKCHTHALFGPEGVQACLELCGPVFDAGCFSEAVEDKNEDGKLYQEGKGSYWSGGPHRALDTDSRGELCKAFGACRTLLYLDGAMDGFIEDVVAKVAVEKACDGTSRESCLGICDPAECCFTAAAGHEGRGYLWNTRGRRVLDDGHLNDDLCTTDGLSDLHCDHYEACSVLLSSSSP